MLIVPGLYKKNEFNLGISAPFAKDFVLYAQHQQSDLGGDKMNKLVQGNLMTSSQLTLIDDLIKRIIQLSSLRYNISDSSVEIRK